MFTAASLLLAFSAGVAAAFNPCGVAMLPSYVGYLLGYGDGQFRGWARGIFSGLRVGILMTMGFLTVFVAAGALVALAGQVLAGVVPWLGVVIGLALVVLGGSMLLGRRIPGLDLSHLTQHLQAERGGRRLWPIYLYGLAYAAASLSCTLPIFLVLVAQSLLAGRFVAGVLAFAVFSLGMGLVVSGLSVSALVARGALARFLPRLMPYVHWVSGLVIVAAGVYIEYYWLSGPAGLLQRLRA